MGRCVAILLIVICLVIRFLLSSISIQNITFIQLIGNVGVVLLVGEVGRFIGWLVAKLMLIKLACRVQKKLKTVQTKKSLIASRPSLFAHG